jgi:hypothetical protein
LVRASRRRDLNVKGPQRAETAPISVARQGPLTCPLATFAVAICNGSKTSTPAVSGAGLSAFHCSGSRAGKRVAKKAAAKKIASEGRRELKRALRPRAERRAKKEGVAWHAAESKVVHPSGLCRVQRRSVIDCLKAILTRKE